MSSAQFLKNVLLFSLAALLPVLSIYILLSPGFAPALVAGGPALVRFLRQVVTNGLPLVFVVNYVSFFLFAFMQRTDRKHRDPAVLVLLDLSIRAVLFIGLHALSYVFSADWFGSFGGSRATSLSVVAPTLARSAFFENISGVYLYATMVSALPLYVSAINQSASLRPLVGLFPQKTGAAVFALLALLLSVVSLTLVAELIAHLQG